MQRCKRAGCDAFFTEHDTAPRLAVPPGSVFVSESASGRAGKGLASTDGNRLARVPCCWRVYMRVCSDPATLLMPALLHPAFVTGATCFILHTRAAGLLMSPDMTKPQEGLDEGSSLRTHADGA